ncbi:hypothetical protein K438DRAFT_1765994 [Mycena galopus ATCC 62051]|nr:hypothetical protein K438DRAFT_1765994 [Mycena galopus ATCC 62051]
MVPNSLQTCQSQYYNIPWGHAGKRARTARATGVMVKTFKNFHLEKKTARALSSANSSKTVDENLSTKLVLNEEQREKLWTLGTFRGFEYGALDYNRAIKRHVPPKFLVHEM